MDQPAADEDKDRVEQGAQDAELDEPHEHPVGLDELAGILKAEADAATRQLRAEGAARVAAGKPPIACIPDGQSIGILQMLGGLDALSPADKKLPLKDGYARVLAKTYPCQRN